jgi:carboxyl-terminal processing protease
VVPFLCLTIFIVGIFLGYSVPKFLNRSETRDSDISSRVVKSNSDLSKEVDLEFIEEVYRTLEDKYLGEFGKDKEKSTYGLVKGLVNSIDNRYTIFLDPEESENYFSQASGDFEGIGIVLAYNGQYTYVETVLKGSPAEDVGMLPGDMIVQVDGQDMESELPGAVAELIRGEADTFVKLKVFREEESVQELEFEIQRKKIEVDNVMWKKIDDSTAKIDIGQFSDVSPSAFNDSWDKIVAEIEIGMPNLKNIVLDLRNNPGGYVFSVRYVLEEFFDNSEILMKERSKEKSEIGYEDNRKGKFEDKKLVVIVNEGSASASEIFASAVQDNNRGEVVGAKTVGKGVEQELVKFEDGSMLLVVFQEWLTPNGRSITPEDPITPDFEVEYTLENLKEANDTQLNKALELLK